MKHIVIGMGEVGRALWEILCDAFGWSVVLGIDIEPMNEIPDVSAGIIHICFPWSDHFVSDVRAYQAKFKPRVTAIHSTVPVGVSDELEAVHTPIRGQHWDMEKSLRSFVKYVGGPPEKAAIVANELLRAGIPVHIVPSAKATEIGKIMDTTLYGILIEYAKDIDAYCRRMGLSSTDVLTYWTKTYNEGYKAIGHPEFTRPIITPIQLPTGGHCVRPNARLVPDDLKRWAEIVIGKTE